MQETKRIYPENPPAPRGNYVLLKEVDYVQKEGEVTRTVTLENKGDCDLGDISVGDTIAILNYGQELLVAYKEEMEGKTVKNKINYLLVNCNQIVGKY